MGWSGYGISVPARWQTGQVASSRSPGSGLPGVTFFPRVAGWAGGRAGDIVAAVKKPLAALAILGAALVVLCAAVPAGALVYWNVWLPSEAQRTRAARLGPVAESFAAGRTPAPADVERLGADRTTRADLLDLLAENAATDLVDARWRTEEARAEADMVRWLHFPTELDAWPDEIELAGRSEVGADRWYVWRFRVHEPHWAAEKGWMVGVSGPWPAAAEATTGTWSELAPYSDDGARTLIAERHAALHRGERPEVRLDAHPAASTGDRPPKRTLP